MCHLCWTPILHISIYIPNGSEQNYFHKASENKKNSWQILVFFFIAKTKICFSVLFFFFFPSTFILKQSKSTIRKYQKISLCTKKKKKNIIPLQFWSSFRKKCIIHWVKQPMCTVHWGADKLLANHSSSCCVRPMAVSLESWALNFPSLWVTGNQNKKINK